MKDFVTDGTWAYALIFGVCCELTEPSRPCSSFTSHYARQRNALQVCNITSCWYLLHVRALFVPLCMHRLSICTGGYCPFSPSLWVFKSSQMPFLY